MTKRRLRVDGTPSPRGGRTPKPPPTEEQLADLERLTDQFPESLRAFRDRGLLNPVRRFRLEEAIRHRSRTLVPVLHGVHNPHNQAAVMRSCEALGLQEFHFIQSVAGGSLHANPRITQNAQGRGSSHFWSRNRPCIVRHVTSTRALPWGMNRSLLAIP